MNRLAIFDCDGTLVDSGATIHAAVAETFAEHGLGVPPAAESRRVIGLSLVEAMAALIPDASPDEHLRLTETYKAKFFAARAEGRVEEPLFDGIPELLDALERMMAARRRDRNRRAACTIASKARHDAALRFASDRRRPIQARPIDGAAGDGDAGAGPDTTVVIGTRPLTWEWRERRGRWESVPAGAITKSWN